MGKKTGRRAAALLASLAMTLSFIAVTESPAAAAACTPTQLKPQVADVTVNQGLGSYSPLVRGKDQLVWGYLVLPACSNGTTDYMEVTGGSLTVSGGTMPATVGATPAPGQIYARVAPS